MPEFISSTCPACSTSLKIPSKLTRLSCGTCGNEFNVKQEGGIVFLEPVGKELKNIDVNTNRAASELAISRLKPEMEKLTTEIWRLKETLNSNVRSEMFIYFHDVGNGDWKGAIDKLSVAQIEELIPLIKPTLIDKLWFFRNPSVEDIVDTLKTLSKRLIELENLQTQLNHHKQIVQKL